MIVSSDFASEPFIIGTMAGQGVEAMLALRCQLQEKKSVLLRQVEEERRRVARLAKSPFHITLANYVQVGAGKHPRAGNA